MNMCFNCGYMWADRDESGHAITGEYCHYEGPDAWAPCEQDEMIPAELADWDEDFEDEVWN